MIVQFSVVPIGSGEELKQAVAGVIDLIDKSGLPYQVTAMSTLVEGDWEEVMGLVRRCHEKMRAGHARVMTTIAIDDRAKVHCRLEGKVRDVEQVLGRTLKK